ncbi:transmembrane protein [Cyclospora cayetanensis]|uniref:Transmembrane protein n=1 Tax=Cyclospora cayetanensis TaxID=88456 RepID=A0A1D3CXX5_9EIME|nr:transmembrane protein [Cyclospora cayetanensis]
MSIPGIDPSGYYFMEYMRASLMQMAIQMLRLPNSTLAFLMVIVVILRPFLSFRVHLEAAILSICSLVCLVWMLCTWAYVACIEKQLLPRQIPHYLVMRYHTEVAGDSAAEYMEEYTPPYKLQKQKNAWPGVCSRYFYGTTLPNKHQQLFCFWANGPNIVMRTLEVWEIQRAENVRRTAELVDGLRVQSTLFAINEGGEMFWKQMQIKALSVSRAVKEQMVVMWASLDEEHLGQIDRPKLFKFLKSQGLSIRTEADVNDFLQIFDRTNKGGVDAEEFYVLLIVIKQLLMEPLDKDALRALFEDKYGIPWTAPTGVDVNSLARILSELGLQWSEGQRRYLLDFVGGKRGTTGVSADLLVSQLQAMEEQTLQPLQQGGSWILETASASSSRQELRGKKLQPRSSTFFQPARHLSWWLCIPNLVGTMATFCESNEEAAELLGLAFPYIGDENTPSELQQQLLLLLSPKRFDFVACQIAAEIVALEDEIEVGHNWNSVEAAEGFPLQQWLQQRGETLYYTWAYLRQEETCDQQHSKTDVHSLVDCSFPIAVIATDAGAVAAGMPSAPPNVSGEGPWLLSNWPNSPSEEATERAADLRRLCESLNQDYALRRRVLLIRANVALQAFLVSVKTSEHEDTVCRVIENLHALEKGEAVPVYLHTPFATKYAQTSFRTSGQTSDEAHSGIGYRKKAELDSANDRGKRRTGSRNNVLAAACATTSRKKDGVEGGARSWIRSQQLVGSTPPCAGGRPQEIDAKAFRQSIDHLTGEGSAVEAGVTSGEAGLMDPMGALRGPGA